MAVILGDNTYYVSSNTNDDCPRPCHPLSYYITDTATYFTSNATFIFMEGEHILDSKGLVRVVINNTDNLTLRGESGHSNTDVIIRCGSNTRGLVFNNGSIINIYDITITGCGQQDTIPLSFTNIASLYIHHITLYNNIYNGSNYIEGGALYIHCVRDTYITITNSAFTNNTVGYDGGGLYIFTDNGTHNDITITNSTFTNNTVGDGGGLYIYTYNGAHNDITITNSTFTNNTVGDGGGLYIHTYNGVHNDITITNSTFTNNTVGYDGGGLYIFTDNGAHNNITITNSTFTNNTVGDGGGLYIDTDTGAHNDITITNSTFTNNTVGRNGGGLYIDTYNGAHNDITITNSTFTNNTVGYGGGLFIYTENGAHNNITITNSTFTNNTVGDGGGLYIYTDGAHNNITITNSACINNAIGGYGGGLAIVTYSNMDNCIIVNSTFANNHGSGILIDHVTVIFTEGHSIVANNSSPTDGGGIFLSDNSYLTTSNGGHVCFINNTANRYGGAIYSTDNDYTSLRSNILYHTYLDQCTVYNLSATFINNSAARAGDNLYGGVFTFCNDLFIGKRYLNYYLLQCINVPDTLKHAPSVHPLSPVSSDPIVVCPCVNDTVNCNITSLCREVYPGQVFNVSLVTVGLCGGVSPGTVVVEHDEQINLMYATTTDYTSTSCTTLNYTVKLTTSIISNTTITINIPGGDIYNIRSINVNLTILPCPLGLVVDFTSGDCVCNNDITHISICDVSWMPYPIQRSGNNWIYHRFDYYNCTIAHIGCPFDYCLKSHVKFTLNESDLQCNYNRSGILCGQCIQGLSLMIGSNRCANCTDMKLVSVSIIILAAVAGVVLVVIVKVFNVTISDGSVNGLLFYAYIVKLNESIYFPKGNVPVISQFVAWMNLDLGLQYCFINGLDGYWKMWLQFVFPLYLWFLVMVIIAACRYSGKVSQLWNRGNNSVSVLATLILMPYTKVLRNITNSFSIITLMCGEYKWHVWNIDGNIDYVSSKHVVLLAVSILFLLAGMVYTGLVLTYQWLLRCSGKCCKGTRDPIVKLKPILDVYTGPYKDKYRFWTGLRLVIHLCLTVLFGLTSGAYSYVNNYIICATVFFLASITVSQRDIRLRYRELLSYVNLFLLSLLSAVFSASSNQSAIYISTIVSVSVEMVLFAIAAVVNFYTVCKKTWPGTCMCLSKYNFKIRVPRHSPHVRYQPLVPSVGADRAQFPDTVINEREPIIFEIDLD